MPAKSMRRSSPVFVSTDTDNGMCMSICDVLLILLLLAIVGFSIRAVFVQKATLESKLQ